MYSFARQKSTRKAPASPRQSLSYQERWHCEAMTERLYEGNGEKGDVL